MARSMQTARKSTGGRPALRQSNTAHTQDDTQDDNNANATTPPAAAAARPRHKRKSAAAADADADATHDGEAAGSAAKAQRTEMDPLHMMAQAAAAAAALPATHAMQCVECGAPATVQCNNECKSFLCAEHDRVTHALKRFSKHQRTPVAQTTNIAPLSGSSGSSNNSCAVFASVSAPLASGQPIATISDAAVNGIRIVAQRDEQGRAHGFGCEVNAAGKMIAGRCGVWSQGLLLERRSVPLSVMPEDLFAEERARGALLLHSNRACYRGELDDRHRAHGEGCWLHADGRVRQKGAFEHGQQITGFREFANGDTYDGQWKDGKHHGEGKRVRKSDGVISEGTWSEDSFVSGKRTLPDNGGCQQGTFVDGWLHGPACVFVSAVGHSYEGGMQHGKQEGIGKVVLANGNSYEGSWLQGKRHGFGVERDKNGGVTLCGEWTAGVGRLCAVPRSKLPAGTLPNPHDCLLLPNGASYRGPVDEQQEPHSLGRLRYSNGDVFEGQFAHSQRRGLGVLWSAEGRLLKCGHWEQSWLWELSSRPVPRRFIPFGEKLTAASREASLFYPSGDYFVGPLNEADQPHGVGQMHTADGLVKQAGTWKDGQFVQAGSSHLPAAAAASSASSSVPAASASAAAPASASAAAAASSLSGLVPVVSSAQKGQAAAQIDQSASPTPSAAAAAASAASSTAQPAAAKKTNGVEAMSIDE